MGKNSRRSTANDKTSITVGMISPLQMKIIQAVNDIGTYKEFTAKTILDTIAPQESPLNTQQIDLLLQEMSGIIVTYDLNPLYTYPTEQEI